MYSRFEVFVAVGKKVIDFWDVTMPCSLVDRYQNFGGTSCFHL